MRIEFIKPVIAAGLLAACTVAGAKVTLVASSWLPPAHLLTMAQQKWCDDVAEATEGRVECKLLPKPVAPAPKTFDAVRDGLADLSLSVHGYTPGRYVLTQLAEFPGLGDSAVQTSVAYQRIYEKYLAKFDEHRGLHVITMFTHGPGNIFNNKQSIKTLADMDGIKFRVGGGVVNDIGKALGVNMTLKPASQSYELLSSGVVDGVWFPYESVLSFKLEKYIKYATTIPGGLYNTSFAFVMNPDTWKRIPKQDQDIINKLSGEYAARLLGSFWDKEDTRSKAQLQVNGTETVAADAQFITEFKAKTKPIEDAWVEAAKAKGLDNAAEVLAEFKAAASGNK